MQIAEMTNFSAVSIYLPFAVTSLILLVFTLRKSGRHEVDRDYIIFNLLMFGWLILEMLFFLLRNPKGIAYVYTAKFAFIAFMPFLLLQMVLGFYRIKKRWPLYATVLLLLIPAVTAVIALIPGLQDLLRYRLQVVSMTPLTVVTNLWGPWYICHLVSTQLPILLIIIVLIRQHRKLARGFQTSANLLVAGLIIYIVGLVMELTGFQGKNDVDYNLLGVFFSSFLFYVAVASSERADYLSIWRRNIYNYIDEGVFVVNDNGILADANTVGMSMLRRLDVKFENIPAEEILQHIRGRGDVVAREYTAENGEVSGEDFYYVGGNFPLVYHMERQPVPMHDRPDSGEYLLLSEVTRNRLLIERLRATAGIDALTGLGNRYSYHQRLRELDIPENLPLSIIMGDVNGLKATNDRYGHAAGDQLLCTVASVLRASTPEAGFAARIGGDEFVVLLPRHDEDQAREIVERIRTALSIPDAIRDTTSIALGCSTKTDESVNINTLIGRADERMYQEKGQRR